MTEHPTAISCDFFWGSHGCGLAGGIPHTIHFCGDSGSFCCEYDEEADPEHRVRCWDDATREWSEWLPSVEGYRRPARYGTEGVEESDEG